MVGWTMCSGIGAPEVAAPWVDWRLAAEIENFPRAVLQSRFGYKLPADHNQGDPLLWADMTEVTPDLARAHGIPLPDVLVAGTPCQAFSVAGLRKGTDDARGNLTLKFVETCHAIVNARHDGRLTVLWENVPGVLSDSGNAFGCFLGGIVGADDALPSPDGGSWPGVGMVSGPRARAAWRVLDAQYFGVAQRRRRVFVAVDFGGAVDPAAVLFERQSLRGNTAPSRDQKQSAAPSIAPCLRGRGNASHRLDTDAYVASSGDIAHCLNAGGMGRIDYETETMIAVGFGAQNSASQGDGVSTEIFATLDKSKIPAIAFGMDNGMAHCLRSGASKVDKPDSTTYVATPWAVRRLTPGECHSLQGFPQGHCAITYRGKLAADGPQYKALGNSMAVPVIAWIMDRIRAEFAANTASVHALTSPP
jgi:DNA (cytosine-5)-methyltransferase 1